MGRVCMKCGEILNKDETQCKHCHSNNVSDFKSSATMGDYFLIRKISDDPTFIKAMLELHDTDPIEYQLKMSQFRNQIEQQKNATQVNSNTIKCPTCNSTKVKRISGTAKVTGAVAFGLFSKTARSQFKCENCGYKW